MIKIGITGGIGSGKSTVSKIFNLFDIPIYIADIESKKLTASSPIIREKLISLFGADLYDNTELNKSKLASIIFSDAEAMKKVNAIIHPEVEKDYIRWTKKQNQRITGKEAAILFETGFDKLVDKTIVVYTPLQLRIERTMARDNISEEDVLKRMNSQMPDEEKIKLSDFVIVNDGSKSLIEQVSNIIDTLKSDEYALRG